MIRPWGLDSAPDPALVPYPVIGWLNGWDQGNVIGQSTIQGYLPGLIKWAVDLQMIVIAANQWSPRDVDMIRCLDWMAEQNDTEDSPYYNIIDTGSVGIIGHSQGGGGVLKVGDGASQSVDIATVVAMHPFGPNWNNKIGDQVAPVLMMGGGEDTTTPTESFLPAWELVKQNGIGGMLIEKPTGTHNSDAWTAPDDPDNPQNYDFGDYQELLRLWWLIFFEGTDGSDFLAELANRGINVLDCAELPFCP